MGGVIRKKGGGPKGKTHGQIKKKRKEKVPDKSL